MKSNHNITCIEDMLSGISTMGIAGHVHPDGDCVGSTLGLYGYIKKYHPEIAVKLYLEPIPHIFEFLKDSDEIIHEVPEGEVFDLFVAMDCSSAERLGRAGKLFENAKKRGCIDHHLTNDLSVDYSYIFPDASSTCELVFELLGEDRIDRYEAECLYTGMVHDTGVFQYSCTSAKTMRIAGILMEKGIDYPGIVDRTFYTKTFDQNRIMGQALLKARRFLNDRVIVSFITAQEMEDFGVHPKELDGIVNQLRVTKDVQVALFLYQLEDGSFKGSLRCNGPVNVAEIAQAFGGGGHEKAAGFGIDGPVEEKLQRILAEIEKQLV